VSASEEVGESCAHFACGGGGTGVEGSAGGRGGVVVVVCGVGAKLQPSFVVLHWLASRDGRTDWVRRRCYMAGVAVEGAVAEEGEDGYGCIAVVRASSGAQCSGMGCFFVVVVGGGGYLKS